MSRVNVELNRFIFVEDLYSLPKLPKEPFVVLALLLVVTLDTVAGSSRADLSLILNVFIAFLTGAFMFNKKTNENLSKEQRAAIESIPADTRTVLDKFNILPTYIPYACCPRCFALYAPTKLPDKSREPFYPRKCTFKTTPNSSPCDTSLLVERHDGAGRSSAPPDDGSPLGCGEFWKPRKIFAYQTMQSWLGRLYSRPRFEEYFDAAWDCAKPGVDIWGADVLQSFLGPNGKRFSIRPPGHSHLVFSLFVDWFNPYGNKQAGKSYSSGAIYMICLNLPIHLRYQLENVYLVGVIPGPTEPSLAEINHFLRPLVDALCQLWQTGFWLSRTAACPAGRLVRGALIPLVCDLPALRKTAGFTGHMSNLFCSFCNLSRKDIQNFDRASWPKKHTWEEHLRYATQWRDAASDSDREKLASRYGVRWSELLRLEYWDPTKFSLLDSMHNLFLGELQHHCRNVWQMNIKSPKTRILLPHDINKQNQQLDSGIKAIVTGSASALKKLRKGYLAALARENAVRVGGSRRVKDFIEALIQWVCQLKPHK